MNSGPFAPTAMPSQKLRGDVYLDKRKVESWKKKQHSPFLGAVWPTLPSVGPALAKAARRSDDITSSLVTLGPHEVTL